MLEHRSTRRVEPPRRFNKARRNLAFAFEAAPNHAGAHYALGLLTHGTEAPGPVIPHFVAAVRAAPERPANWLALAVTLLDASPS